MTPASLRQAVSLLWALAWRDLAGRYRRSLFPAWSLLVPLLMVAAYVGILGAVFRVRFPDSRGGEGFWIPVLCGVLPWFQIHEALRRATTCLVEHAPLARNIRFPLVVLPLHLVAASLLVEAALLLVAAPWLWPTAGAAGFLGLLPVLALQVAFSGGAALLLSAVHVYVRDMAPLVSLALPLWFYISPILYAREQAPAWMGGLHAANPLAPLAAIYRDLLWHGRAPEATDLILFAVWAVAAAAVGLAVFGRLAGRLVDEL